jgi:hypothetical protein
MSFLRAFAAGSWYVRRLLLYSLWVRLVVFLSPFEV